ncbi:MAG: AraC family transcriptional regulator [Clostridiales bacterium]|nr:AraC family transcriptional regulator [Clostridiales bacterium]MDY5514902.1 AraC family transcriptional regulator [Candidatus Ventricola sp.]
MSRRKPENGQETSYFHSRMFIRLFLSYALIIAAFLALYVGLYLSFCSANWRSGVQREMKQKADSWATMMDRQLLAAQSVCAAVNTSENTRSILSTVYVEGHTIDAMQMYRMLNELKRIKGASANVNVYNLMLTFTGDNRVYMGGSVLAVEGESQPLAESPYIGLTTVSHLLGVRSLIGERNGYRERMITITPYARQGMIQSLLSGDVEHQQLEVITDEQFVGLRKAYFMVAVVNVAAGEMSAQQFRDAQELIAHACRELSTEESTLVCCTKNAQNLFVIINSDDGEGMEALFYRMYQSCVEALDDPRFAVTLGVSRLESDIQALRDACTDAEQALGQMMTGGRSSVYFHEDVQDKAQRRYYFPRDAHKRIVRGLKEGNLPDLEAMLGEIYRCNAQEAELPVSELRLMVEELHVTIRNALRDVFDLSTTHIQIERIREAATLEEIFAYYRTVLATAISQRGELPDAGEERALEGKLCAYIEANFCDPALSLNAVAEHFGVSTKMVGLICKEVYGKTFLQCVRDLQIQHAVHLLQTTENTLEEIALQCGFTNLLTFRRNFKAVMGMNPSDYRK